MTEEPTTQPAELDPLIEAGYQLIPLHDHNSEDEYKGKLRKRGKSPLHRNWSKRRYDSAAQKNHMEAGGNVGVRLTATDLVLDVGPRNFPNGQTLESPSNPLTDLTQRLDVDLGGYPTVVTGGGGLHVYMTKPEDVSTRDSLGDDFPGVEFKSLGRQVVAPGSIHPEARWNYRWKSDSPEMDFLGAAEAPVALLELIRRPDCAAPTGGGEHDQEELAQMLEHLDPEDFRDQEAWLELMMACHHATAGDGREEFIEWSTRDPDYIDNGTVIGLRWDSLHSDNQGPRVTHRTLHKLLRDVGAGDAIPRVPAAVNRPGFPGE